MGQKLQPKVSKIFTAKGAKKRFATKDTKDAKHKIT